MIGSLKARSRGPNHRWLTGRPCLLDFINCFVFPKTMGTLIRKVRGGSVVKGSDQSSLIYDVEGLRFAAVFYVELEFRYNFLNAVMSVTI